MAWHQQRERERERENESERSVTSSTIGDPFTVED